MLRYTYIAYLVSAFIILVPEKSIFKDTNYFKRSQKQLLVHAFTLQWKQKCVSVCSNTTSIQTARRIQVY
jgi:hypothetical protein